MNDFFLPVIEYNKHAAVLLIGVSFLVVASQYVPSEILGILSHTSNDTYRQGVLEAQQPSANS